MSRAVVMGVTRVAFLGISKVKNVTLTLHIVHVIITGALSALKINSFRNIFISSSIIDGFWNPSFKINGFLRTEGRKPVH